MEDVPLMRTPYRHQIEGLNLLARHPWYGRWDDMGLGKTYLMQAHALWLIGLGNKSVMVAPPVLLNQYAQSLVKNFVNIDRFVSVKVYEGTITQRQRMLDKFEAEGWPDLLVLSYKAFSGIGPSSVYKKALQIKTQQEADACLAACIRQAPYPDYALATLHDLLKRYNKTALLRFFPAPKITVTTMTFDYQTLLDRGYTDCKVDEATCVGSGSSEIFRAVKAFAGTPDEPNGVTLATGTPVNNSPADVYGLLAILDPKAYPSKRRFYANHVVIDTYAGFERIVGFQNLDKLYAKLYQVGRRVTKTDVLDMPSKVIKEIPFVLAEPHQKLYRQLVNERILELPDDAVIDATQMAKLYHLMQQILLSPEMTGQDVTNQPLIEIKNVIANLHGRKVLIYCWYRRSIETLLKALPDLNPAVLHGGVSPAQREVSKRQFLEDPSCRAFIMQIKAGGVGVDGLQAVASDVIFAEIPTIPGVFAQAVDRLHRAGQTCTVTVYLLVALRTVAVRLRNQLIRKEGTANAVMQDKKTLLAAMLGEEGLQGLI